MELEIPILTERDIELRVGSMSKDGKSCSLLAYKDARVDRRILDKLFGAFGWKREHQLIDGQLFCTVSVWDAEKQQWISKQDVGIESKTQAEKGRASDSFKRACFAWGIGVELYDAPNIWVKLYESELYNGKPYVNFRVKELQYDKEKGEYTKFVIVDKNNVVRWKLGAVDTAGDNAVKPKAEEKAKEKPKAEAKNPANKVANVTKELGGVAAPIGDKYVRFRNGIAEVYSEGSNVWVPVTSMTTYQMQTILANEKYKAAWDSIREFLDR